VLNQKNLIKVVDKFRFLKLNVQPSDNQVIKRNLHQQSIPQNVGIATNGDILTNISRQSNSELRNNVMKLLISFVVNVLLLLKENKDYYYYY
jgi:hypothetical protein